MANVELYKLKKTVEPEVRDYGMYEFFGLGGPYPQNYVKEWAGKLPSGDLATILGRSMIDPPDGYRGGPLGKGDIIVVDGQAHFFDFEMGYKFAEIDFDTSGIKPALHVDYGYTVSMEGALQIPKTLALVCESLDIPIGYESEPGYHGSRKGETSFDSHSSNEYAFPFLHPQFAKGAEAKEFASLLVELTETDFWGKIAGHLRENAPVYMKDLEEARERFAPELLLPAELRPLSKHIPTNVDKSELAYLTARINGMDEQKHKVFEAVMEIGWHSGNVAAIINLTQNLNCFKLQEVFLEAGYGDFCLERDYNECEAVVQRLEMSDDPTERALAKHIHFLHRCVDDEAFGLNSAKEDGGVFTKYGLITIEREVQEVYRGKQDIPDEYRVAEPPAAETDEPLIIISEKIKRQITDVEENIGTNLLNLNEATYSAAVAGHDELVDFIHQHEQEYVEYIRRNCNGYAESEVVKEFGYDEPEKPSVLGRIAEAREKQRREKAESREKPVSQRKKSSRGRDEVL